MAREKGGFWVGLAAVIFYPMTRMLGRRKFSGLEHLPATGPVLVVANHISYIDPVYTAVFTHRGKRVPRFLAKDTLWKIPVLGSILRGSGQIPVRRGTADAQQSLKAGLEAFDANKVVLIYPEGTISRDPDTWPMHSRTGVARLAVERCLDGSVPVIPVVHWGTHQVYDHYKKRLRPFPRKDVIVRAGAPIDLSQYQGRHVDTALLREVTDHLMGAVRDLLAEVRQAEPPAEFYSPRRNGKNSAEDKTEGTEASQAKAAGTEGRSTNNGSSAADNGSSAESNGSKSGEDGHR